jgi:hypothetical protein
MYLDRDTNEEVAPAWDVLLAGIVFATFAVLCANDLHRSFGPQTAKQGKTFLNRRSQRSQRVTIFRSDPMHLDRDTNGEVDPGVGCFSVRDCLCDLCGLLCK